MSTRYNTGNPIESTDVRDMSDNAKNFDEFSNSMSYSFTDRFGVDRQTIEGSIRNAGFQPASFDFLTGGTLVSGDRNKSVFNPTPLGDNNWYSWQGVFPKIIPPGSTPATSGGLGDNAWKPVTNNTIAPTVRESSRRSYAESGYNLVNGSFQTGFTLVNANDVALDEATGKGYSGAAGTYPAGTSTSGFNDRSGDLGFGEVLLDRYGADPSGVLDSSVALALADAAATAIGGGNVAIVLSPGATYRIASHTPINNPLVCYGNRATVKFDYLWSSPMSYVFPSPRQLSNVVLQAVNAGLHTVNLMAGEGYFLEIEKTTMLGFADALANSGVYVNLRKCRLENNLRAWSPKKLSSQNAPSTMFSASETIFVGNVEDGLAVRPGTSGANNDLINLELRSCGFEKNGNGVIALQRIWNLTMVDCWFEGNVTKAYDILASNPTLLNVRVHPSDSAKTNISGWASGTGALSGNVNEIGEGGTQTRNLWLHDVSQDSYPSAKKTKIRKVGDNTRVSEDGGSTEKSLVLSSNLSAGTRTSIELYVPSTAVSIADVVGAPTGWSMVKSGVGIFQFTLPSTLTVRPAITVTPVQTVNLADEDKTAKIALGNTDAATWNSFKTVNRFNVYTKSAVVLTDVGFTIKMMV